MKDITVYDCLDFPAEEFGGENEVKRYVRLIASPQTTGEKRANIVHTTIPAGAVSEGHVHPDADEYIYFDVGGKAVLDDVEYDVPPKGMVHARAGVKHECVNTGSGTLTLLCVFLPSFEPYGAYPRLIERTKKYLSEKE